MANLALYLFFLTMQSPQAHSSSNQRIIRTHRHPLPVQLLLCLTGLSRCLPVIHHLTPLDSFLFSSQVHSYLYYISRTIDLSFIIPTWNPPSKPGLPVASGSWMIVA